MTARTAEMIGVEHIGIGSDLCQDQPDSVVEWMRMGRWTKQVDYGEGSASAPGFPEMPSWFKGNKDFSIVAEGLIAVGFNEKEANSIMGNNWFEFFDKNFEAIS